MDKMRADQMRCGRIIGAPTCSPHTLSRNSWSHRILMEISQGFSLGMNSQFYPKVTSRECTFAQGMADARFPMPTYRRGYLVFRTFPIRVGNVDGYSSGDWYSRSKRSSGRRSAWNQRLPP